MAETTPNKYTEAFASFAPALSIEEIDQRIQDILSGSYERNNTREVKKFLHHRPYHPCRCRHRGEGHEACSQRQ